MFTPSTITPQTQPSKVGQPITFTIAGDPTPEIRWLAGGQTEVPGSRNKPTFTPTAPGLYYCLCWNINPVPSTGGQQTGVVYDDNRKAVIWHHSARHACGWFIAA